MQGIFAEPLILAFRRNKNLSDIIGGNVVFDNKKVLNVKKINKGNHVSADQLTYVVSYSKLAQPFKAFLEKKPF